MRASASKRGYGAAWQKARKGYLISHPDCAMCAKQGIKTQATRVDHIRPHRGDQSLFWDKSNWQALCQPHHDSTKQREEHRGHQIGVTSDGRPIDPSHPWNGGG